MKRAPFRLTFQFRQKTVILSLPYVVLAMCIIVLFIRLGYWQLSRAAEKEAMLSAQTHRATLPPRSLPNEVTALENYTPVIIKGQYDPLHTFIIQNRYFNHHLGVQVITPFKPEKGNVQVLVDRGWLAIEQAKLERIDQHTRTIPITLNGFVYNPGKPFKLNDKLDEPKRWPLQLPQYDQDVMRDHLSSATYPFIIVNVDKTQDFFKYNFEPVSMSPERHKGYAIQWFAFAAVAAIAFISLSIRKET